MSPSLDFDAFLSTYVNTNIVPGSTPYDRKFLVEDLLEGLISANKERFNRVGFHTLVAACCATKRADLVPPLFQAVLERTSGDEEAILELFRFVRETINIIWPFVGIPQVIPACLGLAGYLQSKGINRLPSSREREDFGPNDVYQGTETRKLIYRASANSEVFEMLGTYFGDFAYALNGVGFGYNVFQASQLTFSLLEVELILTTALVALGATRQAGSHIKACIAFGYSEEDVIAVIKMVESLAEWEGIDLPSQKSPIKVKELAEQARKNIKAEEV